MVPPEQEAASQRAAPPLKTREHRAPFGSQGSQLCAPLGFTLGTYPIVRLLAQHLDPGFQPPDTLVREDSQCTSAPGCGGRRDVEQRGTLEKGLLWEDVVTEHAAEDSSPGAWAAYGLAGGCALSVGRYERRSGCYELRVPGPTPQVDEVYEAWCALLTRSAGVTVEHAREELARVIARREPV